MSGSVSDKMLLLIFQYQREERSAGWVSPHGLPVMSADLTEMVMMETASTDFAQVVRGRVSFTDNIPRSPVTAGPSEVTGISAWDEHNGLM